MNQHKQKTHCPRGHEYTPENTRAHRGSRYCKACQAIYNARLTIKRRERKKPERCTPMIGTWQCLKCGEFVKRRDQVCRPQTKGKRPVLAKVPKTADGTEVKEILLTNSTRTALVDAEDYERVSHFRWHMTLDGYVRTMLPRRGATGPSEKFLHRLVLQPPLGKYIDHINRNRLDCRKDNLRFATRAENGRNRSKQKNNTSGYKGVKLVNRKGKASKHESWQAGIKHNGQFHYLGTFQVPEDAARAYDDAAIRLQGEFACLNFPRGEASKAKTADEIDRYRNRNPWCAEWYARDGTVRIQWFRTRREAREEADKHKDAEVYKEMRAT